MDAISSISFEDWGVDGRITLKWESVDWIHPVEVRAKWWSFVETVMNLWVP
jgi:hypothetical protein